MGTPEPPEPPPDAGYQERLAALEAKTERLVNGLGVREVHLGVQRSWKGAAEHAVVRTQGQRTACGYPFEVGHTYLVFAYRGEDGTLWASACGRTRPSDEAVADRALLDAQVVVATKALLEPPRAGCAGCAVARDAGAGGVVGLAVVLLAVVRGRRRRPTPSSVSHEAAPSAVETLYRTRSSSGAVRSVSLAGAIVMSSIGHLLVARPAGVDFDGPVHERRGDQGPEPCPKALLGEELLALVLRHRAEQRHGVGHVLDALQDDVVGAVIRSRSPRGSQRRSRAAW